MKNLVLTFLSVLFLASCDIYPNDEDQDQFGFTVRVSNFENKEYKNMELIIGGMKNGEFVATETLKLPVISKTNIKKTHYFNEGDGRWQPNLDLIRAIPSDSAYFYFKLTEERKGLLGYNTDDGNGGSKFNLAKIAIPEGRIIKNDDGSLTMSIYDYGVSGSLYGQHFKP